MLWSPKAFQCERTAVPGNHDSGLLFLPPGIETPGLEAVTPRPWSPRRTLEPLAAERRAASPASAESAPGARPAVTHAGWLWGPRSAGSGHSSEGSSRTKSPHSPGKRRVLSPIHLHLTPGAPRARPAPAPPRVPSPAPGRLLQPPVPRAARLPPRGARPEAPGSGSASTSRGFDRSAQRRSRTGGGRSARGSGTVRRTGRGGAVSCGRPSPPRPQARPQTLLQPFCPLESLESPVP